MECALVLTKRGHKPTIFEKDGELGGMFITASSMTFKENDKELLNWYRREIKEAGIPVKLNTEVNDIGVLGDFDEVIVATGSVPRTMPTIPGFETTLTFTDILRDQKEVGDKILFIGGGQSSCEAAYDYVRAGKHPIIVEFKSDLIADDATSLCNTSYLRDAMNIIRFLFILNPRSPPLRMVSPLLRTEKPVRPLSLSMTMLLTALALFPTLLQKPPAKCTSSVTVLP